MATGWNGDMKRLGKQPPKVHGGRRKVGGVVARKAPETPPPTKQTRS